MPQDTATDSAVPLPVDLSGQYGLPPGSLIQGPNGPRVVDLTSKRSGPDEGMASAWRTRVEKLGKLAGESDDSPRVQPLANMHAAGDRSNREGLLALTLDAARRLDGEDRRQLGKLVDTLNAVGLAKSFEKTLEAAKALWLLETIAVSPAMVSSQPMAELPPKPEESESGARGGAESRIQVEGDPGNGGARARYGQMECIIRANQLQNLETLAKSADHCVALGPDQKHKKLAERLCGLLTKLGVAAAVEQRGREWRTVTTTRIVVERVRSTTDPVSRRRAETRLRNAAVREHRSAQQARGSI